MIERYKLMSGILFTTLWIQLCYKFLSNDLISGLSGTYSFVVLLTDMIYLVLGLIIIRNKRDLLVFGSFLLIAIVSALVNHLGGFFFLNGFRDFIGLLFVPPIIRYFLTGKDALRFTKSFDKQLYIFLWIQVPCLVFQFFRYGAGDYGGGSLSYGGSGMVSTLIYVISFYLMNKRWDSSRTYFMNLYKNSDLVLLLFVTFLNETKVSFVYMIAYFVLLLKIDKTFVFKLLLMSPLLVVLSLFIGKLYLTATQASEDMFDSEFFDRYFFSAELDYAVDLAINAQYGDLELDYVVDLPRMGRFLFLPEMWENTPGGMALGAGIGQFKGGTVVQTTEFASTYQWLLQGSNVAMYFILVQLGVVGLIWFLVVLWSILFVPDEYPRALNIKMFLALVFLLILVYNDMFRADYICLILFYVCMRGLQPYNELRKEKLWR